MRALWTPDVRDAWYAVFRGHWQRFGPSALATALAEAELVTATEYLLSTGVSPEALQATVDDVMDGGLMDELVLEYDSMYGRCPENPVREHALWRIVELAKLQTATRAEPGE